MANKWEYPKNNEGVILTVKQKDYLKNKEYWDNENKNSESRNLLNN
jgi:acid phosphatase class B